MRYLISLLLFLSVGLGQINDKNFKSEIGDGFYVVVFTSEWQERDLDDSILKGVNGFEDAQIVTVKSADLKKVCKKLRVRNYPSIALFHNGDKVDTWKADMDGEIDCSADDIKSAIEDALASDSY